MNEREAADVLARLDAALHEWWDDDHGSGARHACRPVPSEDEFVAALARHGLVLRAAAQADTPEADDLNSADPNVIYRSGWEKGHAAGLRDAAQADTAPGGGLREALDAAFDKIEASCPVCGGDRWTVEADPSDETGQTPMQVQCWDAEHVVVAEQRAILAALAEPSRDAGLDADDEYHEHVAGDKHSHSFSGPHSHGGVSALSYPRDLAADLARWLQEAIESQPAITIRRGVEPQVAWRALADELLRRWGR